MIIILKYIMVSRTGILDIRDREGVAALLQSIMHMHMHAAMKRAWLSAYTRYTEVNSALHLGRGSVNLSYRYLSSPQISARMRMNCPAIDFAHTNSSTPFARILIFVTPPSCMMAARNTAESE